MKIKVSYTDPKYKDIDEDIDNIFKQIEDRFKEMDQAFKDMDAKINSIEENKWRTHTLVLPKKIGKRWYWPGRQVYRKRMFGPGGVQWIYGTEFDVLKDSK